jgi:hypothetical protein
MTELAGELRTWLEYEPPAGDPDLSEVIAEFRSRHRDSLEAHDLHISERADWRRSSASWTQ